MPKYTPTDEDMESLYSEEAPAETETAETPEAEPAASESEDESMGNEAMMPKSMLPKGAKEGDTFTMRMTKDYGDECGMEMVKGGEAKEPSEEPSADDELDALSKEE